MNGTLVRASSLSVAVFLFTILLAITLLSCNTNRSNENKVSDTNDYTTPKSNHIDTLDIPDHYTVTGTDTALHSAPDTTTKIIGHLSTYDLAEVSLVSGDFLYVSSKGIRDTAVTGWIHKKHLKKALITPPVIKPENRLK